MIIRHIVSALLLLGVGCKTVSQRLIPWTDLNDVRKVEVVGALGVPICHYVEIEATVIKRVGVKGRGDYRLAVEKVDGIRCAKPILMEYEDWTYEVPANAFDLYEHVHGEKKGTLTSDVIREIESHFIGNRYTLLVYESGQFYDPPADEMERHGDIRQLAGWGFSTNLEVMRVIRNGSKDRSPQPVPSTLRR